jgi:hypothetical protein
MSRKVKVVKKNLAPAAKPLGVNPMDPWSTKAGITEASEKELLHRFLDSRGINPEFVSRETKIAHSKSGEFMKWRKDHEFTEETIEEGIFTDVKPMAEENIPEAKTIQGTALDKFRQAAAERARKHDDIEREMKARHAAGKEDMKGSIDRLEKQLNKEESEVNEADQKFIDSLNKLAKTHKVGDSVTVNSKFFGKQKGKVTKVDNQSVHVVRDGKSSSEKYPHDAVVKEESGASKQKETAFHKKLDKLVHGTFGKRKDEMKMKEEVEQIDEITKSDYISAVRKTKDPNFSDDESGPGYSSGREKIINRAEKHQGKKFADKLRKDNYWREFGLHKGVRKGMKKYGNDGKSHPITKDTYKEDVYQDSQAATQTAFDMGTTPNQTEPTHSRRKEMSKSARIIKSIYKNKKMVKEEMYDHEKEDKSVQTYGKKPKMAATDKKDSFGEEKPDAAAIMSGGTTLTGEKRDNVEIDPMMRNKPGQNVFNKEFGKKGS